MLQISLGRVKRKKALLLFEIHYGMRTAFDISLSQHNFIIICCLQMKDVAACHNSAHRYRRFMQLGRVHRTNSISFIQLILFQKLKTNILDFVTSFSILNVDQFHLMINNLLTL